MPSLQRTWQRNVYRLILGLNMVARLAAVLEMDVSAVQGESERTKRPAGGNGMPFTFAFEGHTMNTRSTRCDYRASFVMDFMHIP